MAGTKRMVPIGSNCKKRRLNPIDGCGSRPGGLKKTRMTTATTAPTIQTVSESNSVPKWNDGHRTRPRRVAHLRPILNVLSSMECGVEGIVITG